MKDSPVILISSEGSLGEGGMDDSTEGVYDCEGRDGGKDVGIAGRGDSELERWCSRAWVRV
jgi:hypothetical protein